MNKELLKKLANQLHIPAIGIAPWPLPEIAKEAFHTDKPCPFTNGTVEERFLGGTKLTNPKSAIVCLFPYYVDTPRGVTPNLARYTWGEDYHVVISTYLEKLILAIQEYLFTSKNTATSKDHTLSKDVSISKEDFPEFEIHVDTSPLVDRYMAYLAGLGFYGVNKTFIHPTWGSYTAIGTILTSLYVEPDRPITESCLNCMRCVTACPGNALGDTTFHYEQCKSFITQKKGELSAQEISIMQKTPLIFGCDVCQEVCPHNAMIPTSPIKEFQNILPRIDRESLEPLTNKEFKLAYGNRSFSWRGKKILLRNMDIVKTDTTIK